MWFVRWSFKVYHIRSLLHCLSWSFTRYITTAFHRNVQYNDIACYRTVVKSSSNACTIRRNLTGKVSSQLKYHEATDVGLSPLTVCICFNFIVLWWKANFRHIYIRPLFRCHSIVILLLRVDGEAWSCDDASIHVLTRAVLCSADCSTRRTRSRSVVCISLISKS